MNSKIVNMFTDVYKKNLWKDDESKSGNGSRLDTTVEIRRQLPDFLKKYNIKTFIDLPCGDFNWMKEIINDMDIDKYIGCDIVGEMILENREKYQNDKVSFQQIDITEDKLPDGDLIMCRDVFQHLSNESVSKALDNIRSSNIKYILFTSNRKDDNENNWEETNGRKFCDGWCRTLSLFDSPFNIDDNNIIDTINEGFEAKILYLIEISKL